MKERIVSVGRPPSKSYKFASTTSKYSYLSRKFKSSPSLSPAEIRVMELSLRLYSVEDTAKELNNKSSQAVKNHRKNAYKKLDLDRTGPGARTMDFISKVYGQSCQQLWLCESIEPSAEEKEQWEEQDRSMLKAMANGMSVIDFFHKSDPVVIDKHERRKVLLKRKYA